MKKLFKIFMFVFIVALFASCYTKKSDTPGSLQPLDSVKENDPYKLNVEFLPYYIHTIYKNYVIHNDNTITVYKFEYNGHSYIMFSHGHAENGVVHDPDCPCHTK